MIAVRDRFAVMCDYDLMLKVLRGGFTTPNDGGRMVEIRMDSRSGRLITASSSTRRHQKSNASDEQEDEVSAALRTRASRARTSNFHVVE